MLNAQSPRIEHVDQLRDGIVITFSDEAIVFFPADFMFTVRDHQGTSRLIPAEDGN